MRRRHYSTKNGFCIVFASLEAHDLGREKDVIAPYRLLDDAIAEASQFVVSEDTKDPMTGCFTIKYALPINLKATTRTGKLALRGSPIRFEYPDAPVCTCGAQQELPLDA